LYGRSQIRAGVTGVALAVSLLLVPGAIARPDEHAHATRYVHNAVIFVHGFEGSGAQFESQQLRLTSNGYPASSIVVFEYNSTEFANALQAGAVPPQQEAPLFDRMDKLIARMKALTHRPRVDLLAHSLGTRLMQDYLNSSKKRAHNVAHYVNMDGFPEKSLPGGVNTLALWGTKGPISTPGRRIKGAKNVLVPDSSHVQTATSAFSFKWFYKFFTGESPKTTKIVPQKGKIKLSGRDVNFPQNSGLSGATLQVWAINQATGQRQGKKPIASFQIGSSGYWGPAKVPSGRRYEFAEVRSGFPTHHFYYQPFLRSDHLIRLLESDALRAAGGPPESTSAAMVIVRYKEIWGDQKGQNDVLKVDGVNASNPKTCPLNREVNGLFVGDFNHDGKSEPTQVWPPYEKVSQYFLSSSDIFTPAQTPPKGKVTVSIRDRGHGPTRTLTFPNWAGTTDVVTVQLNDYGQR
jgi:Lipase C-terminal domain/Lipase (class 2)